MKNDVQKDSMLFQRKVLGFLSLFLAPFCVIFGLIGKSTNPMFWYTSISATFYTNANIFMIGILVSISIFFISYKGYDIKDRICSIIEAISAFGIAAFPCFPGRDFTLDPVKDIGLSSNYVGLFQLHISFSNTIHICFACILFLTFAYNLIFLFRLSGPEPTERKKLRNKIYLICGIIILCAIALEIISNFGPLGEITKKGFPLTMIDEFIMLVAFGFSYLVKSEAISKLND